MCPRPGHGGGGVTGSAVRHVEDGKASAALWPRGDVVVRRSLTDARTLQVAWGEGVRRAELATESPALAAWLMSLRGPTSAAALAEEAEVALDMSAREAHALVRHLIEQELFTTAPVAARTPGHHTWSAIGWQDAAVLHAATRDGLTGPAAEPPRYGPDGTRDVSRPAVGGRDRAEPVPAAVELPAVHDRVSRRAVVLPPASPRLAAVDLAAALRNRRTHRNFTNTVLTVQDLADVLHWTFRRVIRQDGHTHLTTQVSVQHTAGATVPLQPFTAFLLLDPKSGPEDLLAVDWRFRYSPAHHALEPTGSGRPSMDSIGELLWDQDFSVGAPAFLVFAVNWSEYMRWCPTSAAYRLTQFDLGAFMQTALLVATALDVRTFLTPALDDERFARILGTDDSEQAPSYLLALGARER